MPCTHDVLRMKLVQDRVMYTWAFNRFNRHKLKLKAPHDDRSRRCTEDGDGGSQAKCCFHQGIGQPAVLHQVIASRKERLRSER